VFHNNFQHPKKYESWASRQTCGLFAASLSYGYLVFSCLTCNDASYYTLVAIFWIFKDNNIGWSVDNNQYLIFVWKMPTRPQTGSLDNAAN
jgi:hypothetical protein